jgi:hypothetical protein
MSGYAQRSVVVRPGQAEVVVKLKPAPKAPPK